MKNLLSLLILFALVPSSAFSQDCIDYGDYPHLVACTETPGLAVSVALSGNYAYISDYSASDPAHFHVVDISDPENSPIVGSLEVPFRINGVAISGHFAFVVGDNFMPVIYRMLVIDVSDPTHPDIVGELDLPSVGFGVAVDGAHAYVAGGSAGFLVVDISDPTNLEIVGIVETTDTVRGVFVSGNMAYLANGDAGLLIVDISIPQSPVIVGSVPTPGHSIKVALSGNHCFIAGWGVGLTIVDVSNPSSPNIVGSLVTGGAAVDVFVAGDFAYIATSAGKKVIIVDVSDLSNPLIVGKVAIFSHTNELEIRGDYAFLTAHNGGFQIIDLGNRSHPPLLGSINPGLLRDVDISGSHAFVVQDTFLLAVDISDFANPQVIDSIAVSATAGNSCTIHGSMALVTRRYFNCGWGPNIPGGLDIIDISDPYNLQIIGSVDTPLDVRGVAAEGNYAYIACIGYSVMPGPGSLKVVDISDPENPWIAGSVEIFETYDVAIMGNTAYVASGYLDLVLVDVGNPSDPSIIETISTGIYPTSVVIENGLAYLAGDGFSIVELQGMTGGTLLGYLPLPHSSFGLAVSEGRAYLGANNNFDVVDVGDPQNPFLIGSRVGGGYIRGVALSGGVVHCATSEGLQTLPIQCDETTGIEDDFFDPEPTETPQPLARLLVHPNPFNPSTTVSFSIDYPQNVELGIYDMTGKRISMLANRIFQTGFYTIDWQGKDLQGRSVASGTYLLRMSADEGVISEKMMLIR